MAIINTPMTREEYIKKYGEEPFSNLKKLNINSTPTEQPKSKGVLGTIASGITKPFARLGTNVVQAGQALAGKPKTQPFSGNFLGEVKPVGQEGSFSQKLKDATGVGLEVASTVLPIGGGAKVAGQLGKGALLNATKTGAKIGATSGGLQGLGSGLQEKDQGLIQTGVEGAAGAITGGLLGGVLGGASTLAANRLAKLGALPKRNQELLRNEARELVTPHLKTISAAERTLAAEAGRVQSPTLFQKGKLMMSDREKEVADSVVGLVRKKNPLQKNVQNLANEIGSKSRGIDDQVEKAMEEAIRSGRPPINYDKFQTAVEDAKIDSQFLFTTDAAQEKAYDSVVELFKSKLVNENFNLIKARRAFDAEIDKKFPTLLSKIGKGEMGDNARIWAIQDMRTLGNDLAEQALPAGNTLKADLRYITNLYKARKNIAKNELITVGQSNWEKFWDSSKGRVLKQALLIGGGLTLGKTIFAGE